MRFLLPAVLAVALTLAGCAPIQLDPQQQVATTLAPFNAQIGLNRISVPSGSRLLAASVDGKPAFCTIQPAWFALGEARRVCFTDDARSGYLSHYYVLGTLRSLTYDAIARSVQPLRARRSRIRACVCGPQRISSDNSGAGEAA
jgi:hypothetical protein